MHADRTSRAMDASRITDETPKYAERQQTEQDRETARNKLLALADLQDLNLRTRPLESRLDRRTLLRVWNPDRQAVGETVCCVHTIDGWEFHAHPTGPLIASAEGVEQSGDPASVEAAAKVAERVSGEHATR